MAAHRRLGRTGFEVSDIVVGGGRISGPKGEEIVRLALDRGVNYVDTSPDYSANGSEEAVGKAIEGRRDGVFLATKFCTARGHLGPGTSVADYMGLVESSLKRLRTDYVDLVHVHSCDETERLLDPNMHEAFDRLRESGKARFLGFSSHTPNLVQVANAAIESKRFDVMMLAYHHGIWPQLARGDRARAPRGGHGRRRDEDLEGCEAQRAGRVPRARRGLLAGRAQVGALEPERVVRGDLVLRVPARRRVPARLGREAHPGRRRAPRGVRPPDRSGATARRTAASASTRARSSSPIDDVLRYRMYFEDYGDEKEAIRLYGALEKNASVCASCSGPCLGVCPVGVPIPDRMLGAHDLLSLV